MKSNKIESQKNTFAVRFGDWNRLSDVIDK